jgi:hypothetical protein
MTTQPISRSAILDQPAHLLEGANFQIVVPEESTNLIANPSFETNTTGWSAAGTGVTITRDTSISFFGAASGRMSDASPSNSGSEYVIASLMPATAGQVYTLSFYYWKRASGAQTGRAFLAFYDAGSSQISTVSLTLAPGNVAQWKRADIAALAPASTAFVTCIFTTQGVSTGQYDLYLDGVQIEAKPYPTTYIDGDQEGCVWIGAAHASSSFRPVTTRKGGRPMSLSDYKFKVAAVIGAGAAALSTVATPYANIGGAYYQRSIPQARTLQIAGQFECDGQIDLMRNRAALIDAVNPNRTPQPQPARLLYTPLGCAADDVSRQVVIDGVYGGGLEGNQTNEVGVERAVMSFNIYFPFAAVASGAGDRSVPATVNQVLSSPNDLVSRNRVTGAWSTLSGGAPGGISRILMGTDGLPIFIGAFTTIGGVSANYVARWNGSTFVALSTGPGGASGVLTGAVGPDGSVYYGYSTSLTNYRIRKWNGASWSTLADFTHGSDARLDAIAVAPNGDIYAAGQFTNAGGTAITNIARYNGTAWSALGTAPNGRVRALAFDKAGNLYAGGAFTTIGGTSANRIARWNGSAWSALGAGMTKSAGTCVVTTLYVARNGMLYAYGDFDTAGGVNALNIATWNGGGWWPLGSGLTKTVTGYEGAIYEDDGPGVVVAGYYTLASNPNIMFLSRWTSSVWIPGPVHFLTGSGSYLTGVMDVGITQFVGGTFNYLTINNSMIVPAVTTITPTTQTNNLKFVFTGPGTLVSVRNFATGDELFFDLALNAGEVATLTLGERISFTSNLRGDISGALIGTSGLTRFRLLPGPNPVAVMMINTTGASAVSIVFKEMFASLNPLP